MLGFVPKPNLIIPNSLNPKSVLESFGGRKSTPQRHLLMGETPKTAMAQLSAKSKIQNHYEVGNFKRY